MLFLLISLSLIATLFMAYRTADLPYETLKKKYSTPASRFMQVQGMELHYCDEGPRTDSLPFILFHGTASSLHTWDSLVQLFPNKRIIRLDLPGYGLTGPHPYADYRTQTYMQLFDTLCARLKVDSCIVGGNSLGGLLAWQYALHNAKVKKLMLFNAAGYPMQNSGGNIGFQIARTPLLNQLLKHITPRSLFRKSLEQSFGNPSSVSDELVNRHFELTLRPGNRQAIIDRFTYKEKIDTMPLSAIRIPVLILWGEKDRVIPVENALRFARALPNNKLMIYPTLGHVPMEENALLVSNDIKAWLQSR